MAWGIDYGRNVITAKKELGEIPRETCPDIDKIIETLEKLREDNAQLRTLGREWYEFADKLASEAQENYDELDKEKEQLEETVKRLEADVKHYENELNNR